MEQRERESDAEGDNIFTLTIASGEVALASLFERRSARIWEVNLEKSSLRLPQSAMAAAGIKPGRAVDLFRNWGLSDIQFRRLGDDGMLDLNDRLGPNSTWHEGTRLLLTHVGPWLIVRKWPDLSGGFLAEDTKKILATINSAGPEGLSEDEIQASCPCLDGRTHMDILSNMGVILPVRDGYFSAIESLLETLGQGDDVDVAMLKANDALPKRLKSSRPYYRRPSRGNVSEKPLLHSKISDKTSA